MRESKIEKELLELTALKPKKKEERQEYLSRLMRVVSKLPDPDWEGLTTEAQDWNNAAADAVTNEDEIQEFPDYVEIEEDVPEEEPVVEKKRTRAAPIVQQHRKASACHTLKKFVAQNPAITVAELSDKLSSEGFKVTDVTIATLRSNVRDILRVLNELNLGNFVL